MVLKRLAGGKPLSWVAMEAHVYVQFLVALVKSRRRNRICRHHHHRVSIHLCSHFGSSLFQRAQPALVMPFQKPSGVRKNT